MHSRRQRKKRRLENVKHSEADEQKREINAISGPAQKKSTKQ
jgi:hypothetical protein